MTEPWITLTGYAAIALVLAAYCVNATVQMRRAGRKAMARVAAAAEKRGRVDIAAMADGLDLEAITREFLNQCGRCDYGMVEYGCACTDSDYRPPMSQLVRVIEQMRKAATDAPVA